MPAMQWCHGTGGCKNSPVIMTEGYSLVWILGSMFVLILVQRNNVYYYFPSHSQYTIHWAQTRASQFHHWPRSASILFYTNYTLTAELASSDGSDHLSLSHPFMNLSSDCIQPLITLQQNSSLLQRWNISQKLPHIFQTQRLTAPPLSLS